jgi:hypothetical protein
MRRRGSSPTVPRLYVWQKALAEKRGEIEAGLLAGRVQVRYEALWAERPRFAHRALRDHLEKVILPGLALYRALLEESEDREAVLADVERLFEAAYGGAAKIMPYLDRVPQFFTLFRVGARRALRREFPPEGFEAEIVEDSERAFAFDMRRCFYLDVLTAYGAPELTPAFCKMDDLLYEGLPASIGWERRGTLGRGDECCDFRWTARGAPS